MILSRQKAYGYMEKQTQRPIPVCVILKKPHIRIHNRTHSEQTLQGKITRFLFRPKCSQVHEFNLWQEMATCLTRPFCYQWVVGHTRAHCTGQPHQELGWDGTWKRGGGLISLQGTRRTHCQRYNRFSRAAVYLKW